MNKLLPLRLKRWLADQKEGMLTLGGKNQPFIVLLRLLVMRLAGRAAVIPKMTVETIATR